MSIIKMNNIQTNYHIRNPKTCVKYKNFYNVGYNLYKNLWYYKQSFTYLLPFFINFDKFITNLSYFQLKK